MQRPAHRSRLSIVGAFAFIAACVTVNIYFPAAKVEKTAEKIVDEVYREKKEPAPAEQKEKPQSRNDGGVSGVVIRLARLVWVRPVAAPYQAFRRSLDQCLSQCDDVGIAGWAVHRVVVSDRQLHPRPALVDEAAHHCVRRMTSAVGS